MFAYAFKGRMQLFQRANKATAETKMVLKEGQNESCLMLLPREFFNGALGTGHIVPLPDFLL